ncbi:MAG: class I SAM-dependent methyltransferase [Candidatus Doudnabacteria bacterium]|jgi:ubiquinone/menaquinone biosynthesis C-methylase UbiE
MLSPNEQENLETYNQIASGWAATMRSDFWLKEYENFQKFLPSGKVLDIGCGSGADSLWFTKNNYDYTGVDISETMIRLAKEGNAEANFEVKSFYELDFPPQNFDGFWSACSLIHAEREKIQEVLFGIKRVLKTGAIGFVAVKEGAGEKMAPWQDSGKKRFFVYYGQDEFAKILQTAGFEILQIATRPPPDSRQDGTFLVYYVKNK